MFDGDHPTPHLTFADFPGFMDRDINNLTADLEIELDNGMTLTSITNWQNIDKFYTEDGDGIPVPIIEFTTIADFTQISEEIRLAWATETTRWQVGAYFLDIDMDGDVVTRGAPVAGVAASLGFDPAMLTDHGSRAGLHAGVSKLVGVRSRRVRSQRRLHAYRRTALFAGRQGNRLRDGFPVSG